MSVHLKSIKGEIEDVINSTPDEPKYIDITLSLNSFWGGTRKGTCIQLTLETEYIKLTKDEIILLRDELNKWIIQT